MAYRSAQIYVQYRTLSRLRSACKLYPKEVGAALGDVSETVDERADRLLNEAIDREYPNVLEMEKEISTIEKKYMKGKVC